MNRRILGLLMGLGAPLLLPVQALAAEEKVESGQAELPAEPWTFEEQLSETSHTVVVGGRSLTYEATAGTLLLKDESGAKKASVFYMAYTLDGAGDPSERPLTFSFNGGPGSSSVWLHLGLLGPRRVLMSDEGHALPPPYELVYNEFSLLDVTDLVFIDPVTTG